MKSPLNLSTAASGQELKTVKPKTEALVVALLFACLIPLELLCALLAYETIGEMTRSLYLLGIVAFNLLFSLLALRHRAAAALGAVALALLVIPYQVVLGDRLLRAQAEAARIVAFAYEQKIQQGTFPADLSGYTFGDAALKPYFHEYQLDKTRGQFAVSYWIGTESTSHSYSSETGWGYYPD